MRDALASADRAAIERWNDAARADRDALLGAGLAGGAVHELRAAVADRPGAVAEIALALGRAQINIVDMALSPSRDGSQGVVALWVRGEEQAARADAADRGARDPGRPGMSEGAHGRSASALRARAGRGRSRSPRWSELRMR